MTAKDGTEDFFLLGLARGDLICMFVFRSPFVRDEENLTGIPSAYMVRKKIEKKVCSFLFY